MALQLLSAGAAKGLVGALQASFAATAGVELKGTFGAVGAIRELLDAGTPCDVLIVTAAMQAQLAESGRVRRESIVALGRVNTGVAVRSGEARPPIGDRGDLRAAFAAAREIYLPDPSKATAGIHCVNMLTALGLYPGIASRLRAYPNGAAAMAALAQTSQAQLLGCTQVTEIRYTPGVDLVGPLPAEFGLATTYSISVTTSARAPEVAQRFIEHLSGPAGRAVRAAGGFEG